MIEPSIYRGTVMHHRRRPVDHRFTYKVFSLLLDIDCLAETGSRLRCLGVDHFSLFSFHHRDHGPRDGSPLRPWVELQLAEWGRPTQPARIMLLSMPRLLGYVFNPLSVYFCYDQDERLESVVYEVKNTFGSQHVYALASPNDAGGSAFSHACNKKFYVSPFIDMDAQYQFRLRDPSERLTMTIRETDGKSCFFVASHTARRQPLTDRNLLACWLAHGLMSVKVMAGIHFEALKLWLKGAPYFSRDVKGT